MKIFITTYPFNENHSIIKDLEKDGHTFFFNKYRRKMSPDEVAEEHLRINPDAIVAGTEMYDSNMLDNCKNVKIISRVGIGMDSVDISECEKRDIMVTNTPDGPTDAVSDLVIGQMINSLRRIQFVDYDMRQSGWDRFVGRDIKNCDIGNNWMW